MVEKKLVLESIDEIVDALDIVSEDMDAYLDSQTGDVKLVSQLDLDLLELDADDEDIPDWQKDCSVQTKAIMENEGGRFLKLPDAFERHDWEIMKSFAVTRTDDKVSMALEAAIHRSGAFARFKAVIASMHLTAEWYQFRKEVLSKIAFAWCDENDVNVVGHIKETIDYYEVDEEENNDSNRSAI